MNTSYGYTYTFPALRGTQAGRQYYVGMCPLKLIPRIFLFDEAPVPPELRAQRTLNTARVPEIARYVVENPHDYAFSAITASIDGEVRFDPVEIDGAVLDVGQLVVPMSARFVINDGQHRRAAIEQALEETPELGEETIAVVFFLDTGLHRSQQLFADLNKHAVRPTKSIGILYDQRDPMAQLCRRIIEQVSLFRGLTETEKTSISHRSSKLFTLSAIYQATTELLRKKGEASEVSQVEAKLAAEFWERLGDVIPEWRLAKERKISAVELRRDYIHVHGVILQAMGRVGASLLAQYPEDWQMRLERLATLDWARTNIELWEGRAMVNGRVSKARVNILLTGNIMKTTIGLPLMPEERKLEDQHNARVALQSGKSA